MCCLSFVNVFTRNHVVRWSLLNEVKLPIGNNLAELTIQKMTTRRHNSLYYGSYAGAEMAFAYHSVIRTVKFHGSSVWNFIGTISKISLSDAGIMLIWFLAKPLWLPANVNFKTN